MFRAIALTLRARLRFASLTPREFFVGQRIPGRILPRAYQRSVSYSPDLVGCRRLLPCDRWPLEVFGSFRHLERPIQPCHSRSRQPVLLSFSFGAPALPY